MICIWECGGGGGGNGRGSGSGGVFYRRGC